MLFNSLEFAVFLPLVLLGYWLLPLRGQNRFLLLASYVFYGWWDPRFLFLIVVSTVIDYTTALFMQNGRLNIRQRLWPSVYLVSACYAFLGVDWKALGGIFTGTAIPASAFVPDAFARTVLVISIVGAVGLNLAYRYVRRVQLKPQRTLLLVTSVVANLGLLGVFKYFDFFVESAEALATAFGLDAPSLRLNVVLPVGISFYTFQTLSYTVGVFRGETTATRQFEDFALFVAFFPQLVAGPIERASKLLPQIAVSRAVTTKIFTRGLYLILFGLFKKVAIADGLAGSVDSIYNTTGAVSTLDVIGATFFFAFQIYCDFSGYSDIARGTAKLLGFDLMTNFNVPYVSTNPSEFWRRWHISLSSWLRDYLYIPLGGSRGGSEKKTYRNLMTTMTLGGLWHGAAWNYVLWGIYQGGILCIHRVWSRAIGAGKKAREGAAGLTAKLFGIGFFFVITCYGWLLFRATSMGQIGEFTMSLFGFADGSGISVKRPTLAALIGLPLLLLLDIGQVGKNDAHWYRRLPAPVRGAIYAALFFIFVMGLSNDPVQFIYFQF